MDAEEAGLWRRWRSAAAEPAVDAGLRAIHDEMAQRILQRGPICWTSGRCCNFDAFGHRLYVTGLEVAWTLNRLGAPGEGASGLSLPVISTPAVTPDAIDLRGPCPFQVEKRCTVHAIRPLGCRVFFCQEGTQDWQHAVYEELQGRLQTLHDQQSVPYRYMEWRGALRDGLSAVTADRAIPTAAE